jgi:hypothetical protein
VKVGVKGKPLMKLEAESEKVKQEWFDTVKALKTELNERQSTKQKRTYDNEYIITCYLIHSIL